MSGRARPRFAVLVCSDEECTEIFEAYGPLEELEALACDCGCALQVISISEAPASLTAAAVELLPLG